jgi:hypothetical protein
MNLTGDPQYDRVNARLAGLTRLQAIRVNQRLSFLLRAHMDSALIVAAIDAAIDIELSGMAPPPPSCRQAPITAAEAPTPPPHLCPMPHTLPEPPKEGI